MVAHDLGEAQGAELSGLDDDDLAVRGVLRDGLEVDLLPERRRDEEGDLGVGQGACHVRVGLRDLREATFLACGRRALDEDPAERVDDLDLLGVLWHGDEVDVVPAQGHTPGECLAGIAGTQDGDAHWGSMA